MNIKVQLDGVKVYNDAKVLTGVKIRSGGDLEIKARNLEVTDKAEVLTDGNRRSFKESGKCFTGT